MKVSPRDHVIAETVDDETVLVNLNSNRIFELNPTASRIWELVGEGQTTDEIRGQLVSEFDVSEDEAQEGIRELVTFLKKESLVD